MKRSNFKNQLINSSAYQLISTSANQLILLAIITSANLLISSSIIAQTPQKLSYQAVVRNTSGVLASGQTVGMRISILQGSATGTAVYVETHKTTTNVNGLATVIIGAGSVVSGNFATIDWASGTYYLRTETDPDGGSSYNIAGTSQLLSVPYALNSKTSESVADNSVTSAKIADGAVASADLAINAVTTEKINAGAVTGAKIAQAGAASGQALKWNGTTWAPANDATGGGDITLPWTGNATTGIDNYAFTVVSTGQDISAISGKQTNTTAGSSGYGVYGESLSPYGTGVFAYSNGSNGRGVYANGYVAVRAVGNYRGVDANGDKAVEGRSYSSTGFGVGGYSPVCGIYGEAWNSGGKGVYGKSTGDVLWDTTCGVYGEANTEHAWGVKGYVSDTIGANFGVYGESISKNGHGVGGTAKKRGVYGRSTGFQGVGVEGEALADNSIGVSGKALNTNGTGVYGEGNKQGIYGLSSNTGVYGTSSGYKGIGIAGVRVFGAKATTRVSTVFQQRSQGKASMGPYPVPPEPITVCMAKQNLQEDLVCMERDPPTEFMESVTGSMDSEYMANRPQLPVMASMGMPLKSEYMEYLPLPQVPGCMGKPRNTAYMDLPL